MCNDRAELVGTGIADAAAIPTHPFEQQKRFHTPSAVWIITPYLPQQIVLIVPAAAQRPVPIVQRKPGHGFGALALRRIAGLPFGDERSHTIRRKYQLRLSVTRR